MIGELEERLHEIQEIKSRTSGADRLMCDAFIMGFTEAAKISMEYLKNLNKKEKQNELYS